MMRSTALNLFLLQGFLTVLAAPSAPEDPCGKVAGLQFAKPADVRACLNVFPFNETLRQNVLQVVSRVFDFYTFEDWYLKIAPPFQESTTNIRAELARINSTKYATDFAFNHDLFDFANGLNDGHTDWFPACYWDAYQNILPAPVVSLEENGVQNVFIAPDSVELLTQLGSNFTGFFESINFDWQRLAGAKVLTIEGMDAYDYVDHIASTVSGNYLDHGVRVNSVFSSYRIATTSFSQRVGDLAGPPFPDLDSLTFELIPVGQTKPETVTVPYLANFLGVPFTDSASYWENNCVATSDTNGVDEDSITPDVQGGHAPKKQPRAFIVDKTMNMGVNLPPQFVPSLPIVNASAGVIKSYILPDGKTGVMFVGSFEGDFVQFQTDTVSAFNKFQAEGVSRLIIDLTDNGGGFVCLGFFLHQYLAGTDFGYPGFVSSARGNELAQKIVANNVAKGITNTFYSPLNWAFLNDTPFPLTENYMKPTLPFLINGKSDPTSQRFHDICTPFNVPVPATPIIPIQNVAIVGNANCASTCAMFSTLMNERHGTKIAIFGGKPGESMEFKGMAGNQVLEWTDIDTEIKSAGLKDDPLAPPDLLVNADFRHNWRTAWSFFDEQKPIAFVSELPKFRFAYTNETYNNPQNLWVFAAQKLFD